MITKDRTSAIATLIALSMMGVVPQPPKRPEDDIEGVPLDELELGPNGIQRKKQEPPK